MGMMQIGRERRVVGGTAVALPVTVSGAIHAIDIGVATFAERYVAQADPRRVFIDSVVQVEPNEGNFGGYQRGIVANPDRR